MFAAFMAWTQPEPHHSVLDVGATADREYSHSNYFEAWYPHTDRIIAVGLQDASFLEQKHPGMRFVFADGRMLPFPDASFDFVHSSAVLEHVGSRKNQQDFIAELWRVARRGVFLTVPNPWFPIEFHTMVPFLHWLPAPLFRSVLRRMGHDFLAREENLNLLPAGALKRMAAACGMAKPELSTVSLAGLPTNLILTARKP